MSHYCPYCGTRFEYKLDCREHAEFLCDRDDIPEAGDQLLREDGLDDQQRLELGVYLLHANEIDMG